MGLITQRNPTAEMISKSRALAQGAYYQATIGEGGALTDSYIEIDTDTLWAFREACRQDKATAEEMTRRTENSERFNDYILDEVVRFPKTEATVKQTSFGRTITQAARGNLYRGERKMWPESRSTLGRALNAIPNAAERERYRLVAAMRTAAFAELMLEFDITHHWCTGYDVDLMFIPLAQHYGLETIMIDFTDDFDTALFFATCIFDQEKSEYRPLREDEIKRGTPSEYGVVFSIPRWQAEQVSVILHSYEPSSPDCFTADPVGYQPFMRCHSQHGYGVVLNEGACLQNIRYFEKLKFKQSADLSQEVFNLMEGGNLVFPNEGLSSVLDVIEDIKHAWSFSGDEFEHGYVIAGGDEQFGSRDKAHALLAANKCKGHVVNVSEVSKCYSLSRQRKRAVNRAYEEYDLAKASGTPYLWSKPRMPY